MTFTSKRTFKKTNNENFCTQINKVKAGLIMSYSGHSNFFKNNPFFVASLVKVNISNNRRHCCEGFIINTFYYS